MTEIRFYHLQTTPLERALPGILTQAHQRGMRVIVRCPDEESVKSIDALLWSFAPESFLPHASRGDATRQPIWISTDDKNVNDANVLVLTGATQSENLKEFDLCCEIFDGMDQDAVQGARARWKSLKDEGYNLKYYQQTENGGWEQKA